MYIHQFSSRYRTKTLDDVIVSKCIFRCSRRRRGQGEDGCQFDTHIISGPSLWCHPNVRRYDPHAQLHRNFGKLHTAQNKLDEAIEDLSKDIYCSSLEVGPEHIDTSAGYFLVANIFYAQRKVTPFLQYTTVTRSRGALLYSTQIGDERQSLSRRCPRNVVSLLSDDVGHGAYLSEQTEEHWLHRLQN